MKATNNKTYISGKDAALEDTIKSINNILKKLSISIIESSWKHPLNNLYSVHIKEKTHPELYTNGKGKCKKSALASAYGEFIERLTSNYFFSGYFLKPSNNFFTYFKDEKWVKIKDNNFPAIILNPKLLNFYNLDKELTPQNLKDVNASKQTGDICLLPFSNLKNEETVYFPMSLIDNLYASNGMAAGNSSYEAKVQALCEIVERFVKFKVFKENLTLPNYKVNQTPTISSMKNFLIEKGFKVYLKDASLGGVYPVANVTIINLHDGGCFSSFGAHPDVETAFERCLTELLQGRELKDLIGLRRPVHFNEEVKSADNLESHFINSDGLVSFDFFKSDTSFPFKECSFKGSTKEQCQFLQKLIEAQGFDIYCAEYSYTGFYSCRIIIPEMSEVYPVSDLVWNNPFQDKSFFREQLFQLNTFDLNSLSSLLKELENRDISDNMLVKDLIGIFFNEKSFYATFLVVELKVFLTLATEEKEFTLELLDRCLFTGDIQNNRKKMYECLKILLELDSLNDLGNYFGIFEDVYGHSLLNECLLLLKKEIYFPHALTKENNKNILSEHNSFLKIYSTLQEMKNDEADIK